MGYDSPKHWLHVTFGKCWDLHRKRQTERQEETEIEGRGKGREHTEGRLRE
jgi:hypothetical protein